MRQIIKDISDFIFVSHEPEKADIIFIPGGSSPQTGEKAARLFGEGYAPFILPAGKFGVKKGRFAGVKSNRSKYNGSYETEWGFLSDVLLKNGVPAANILKEAESGYTYENALFSRKVTDGRNMKIDKAILCCKSFHARRAWIYYQLAYPDTEFLVVPADVFNITKETWYSSEFGFDKVMGELSRCGHQAAQSIKEAMNITTTENFDIYDRNWKKTGKIIPRGMPMDVGEYNLSVFVWIVNSKGKFLITRRSPNKTYPGCWECPGGGVSSGQDSRESALREAKEETGIDLSGGAGRLIKQYRTQTSLVDAWAFRHETDLAEVVCQKFETSEAKLAAMEEILEMHENGEFIPIPTHHLKDMLEWSLNCDF